jgi:hypothetical protein
MFFTTTTTTSANLGIKLGCARKQLDSCWVLGGMGTRGAPSKMHQAILEKGGLVNMYQKCKMVWRAPRRGSGGFYLFILLFFVDIIIMIFRITKI